MLPYLKFLHSHFSGVPENIHSISVPSMFVFIIMSCAPPASIIPPVNVVLSAIILSIWM